MKTFIAYRFSGENPRQLEPLLTAVRDGLVDRGVEAYCTFFDESSFKYKNMDARQIMDHAFAFIDDCDFLFVLQTSNNKSEGMLMEVGYCLAKNIPIVSATKQEVNKTYLPDMASISLCWKDVDDLTKQIKKIDLSSIELRKT